MTKVALDDGEVIIELRRNLIDCFARARRALDSIEGTYNRTETWLRDDRARSVSTTLRRHEERFSETKIALMEAKTSIGDQRPRTHETEERDFRRSRAQCEETAVLMKRIQHWLIKLPRELAEPIAQLRRTCNALDSMSPKAIAHLDNKIEAIEKYQTAHLSKDKDAP
jgi:hypothetical protein